MPIIPISGSATARGALVPFGFYKTVVGDAATITFNNLPQNCQDIYFVVSSGSGLGGTFAGSTLYLNNQQNNTSYSNTSLSGDGNMTSSQITSGRNTAPFGFNFSLPSTGLPSTIYAATTGNILNYTNASSTKMLTNRTALETNGLGYSQMQAQLYRLTGAITRLDFVCSGGWYAGTTFSIYGVRSINQ
jgi:hypothetical protein